MEKSEKDSRSLFFASTTPIFRQAVFALSLLLVLLLLPAPARSQAQTATEHRPTSQPYAGDLSIFDSPGRDKRLQINRVMDMMGIKPGRTVADIGAGGGWFTVQAARRVGEMGMVYAVDINPEAMDYIQRRAKKENLGNIRTVLSEPDDPELPPESVDAVLLLKTYHEISQPVALLSNLRGALRPGAKVGIIDRNGTAENHGVNRDIVLKEAAEAGYRFVSQADFVKGDGMDYFLIFAAK